MGILKKLKREISIILSTALTIGTCFIPKTSTIYAEEDLSIDFYDKCAELIQENWNKNYDIEGAAVGSKFQTMRLIVKTKNNNLDVSKYEPKDIVKYENIIVLQFDTIEKAKTAYDDLKSNENIEYVEVDKVIQLDSNLVEVVDKDELNTNDFDSSSSHNSWGVERIEADQYSEYLYNSGKNNNLTVAVVDTGVDYNHSYLSGRLLSGYNVIDGNYDPYDGHSHGTHVSGTIVDCTLELNKIKILPVKVLGDNGWGTTLAIGNGIRYAISRGSNVINLSLGGDHDLYVDDAIASAISENIAVVVAAGNDNMDTEYFCPSHINEAIVVASTDSSDYKSNFSNYGSSVDICAPGEYIRSCTPGNSYGYMNGTSMATPHISATVAMYKLGNPDLSVSQVESLLKTNTKDLGDTSWDKYYGSGQPKLSKAIPKKSLTKDIYKYDAGKGNYLTYINGRGYSQFTYLNASGNYAFTPSSWMKAAGLTVTMPTKSNGYTMKITNSYIKMYDEATNLLNDIKSNNISKQDVKSQLNEIESIKLQDEIESDNIKNQDKVTKTLTKDIYKYDAGKGNYLTYINGRGYSQYSYLNASGNYAFTPSSWMKAAGLTVTMPTKSNGYTMKITNPYISKYKNIVKEIETMIK